MTAYTPAPWKVLYGYDNIISETIPGRHTIRGSDDYNVARIWESLAGGAPEANARLIVAAVNSYAAHCGERAVECAEGDLIGELLAALEAFVNFNQHFATRSYYELLKAARAAIAKAKRGE